VSRLISLLPSLTEILYRLGLGESVVGITHECDYPPDVHTKTIVTTSDIAHGLSSLAIEARVQEQLTAEKALYGLKIEELRRLQPDILFTQGLCDVCAVSETLVRVVAQTLTPAPQVVALGPTNLTEILASIDYIGQVTGCEQASYNLRQQLEARIQFVETQAQALPKPRVFCLEWLAPPYSGGHWMPELVQRAGGIAWGEVGKPSRQVHWEEIVAFQPEIVVVLPCGFDIPRTCQEMPLLWENPLWCSLPAVQNQRVYVTDGNSYFNRPGPRVVDSLEILAEIFHPQTFGGLAPVGSFQHWS
jgi:iron complex transport system substrate-binding protein